MQKTDCVDANEGVHMVRFHVRVMHWCMRCRTRLGSTPILCDCDVRFQCKYNIPFPDITNRSRTSHHVNEPLASSDTLFLHIATLLSSQFQTRMKMYCRKSVDFDEVEEDVARAVEIRITISVWKNKRPPYH